mmetsp:Transcript_11880/g.24562  ORF Transcript_11880/g.24562 Transcript_11880/m.24562 type:complete len:112 (+) Transcript_11880:1641-1976(+)
MVRVFGVGQEHCAAAAGGGGRGGAIGATGDTSRLVVASAAAVRGCISEMGADTSAGEGLRQVSLVEEGEKVAGVGIGHGHLMFSRRSSDVWIVVDRLARSRVLLLVGLLQR